MVSDLKSLALKGCKFAAAGKVFFYRFFSLSLNLFLPPLPKIQCPYFLDFWNPWGKVTKRSGLKFYNFCLSLTIRIFLYRCYYPHWSRDAFALSPVCGIFFWKPKTLGICPCFNAKVPMFSPLGGLLSQKCQFKGKLNLHI